jgi:hypothetical protein
MPTVLFDVVAARTRGSTPEWMEADALADAAVLGDRACWDELHSRFSPMITAFARRYCNQLGHRRPADARGQGSCRGWECDRAFGSAYAELCRRTLGDPPDADGASVGRLPVWSARNLDDNAFARAMHSELRASGRMTDVFRTWCADRGLPQRPRLNTRRARELDQAVSRTAGQLLGEGRPATIDSAQRWLESLHWDAAQIGTIEPIDSERVQRHLARRAVDVMAIDADTFRNLAYAVDDDICTLAPDIHDDYLSAARDQTRVHATLDTIRE